MRRALLLAIPLVLVACGGKAATKVATTTSATSPVDAVRAATKKTTAAGSETARLTVAVTANGQQVHLTGKGTFTTTGLKGKMSLKLHAGTVSTTFEEVLAGKDLYLSSPLLTTSLPKGKTWVKMDVASVGAAGGLDLQSLVTASPAGELSKLQAVTSARGVGSSVIGGLHATHYRVSLDRSKLPAALKSSGVSVYDVWVGDDGYVHRFVIAVPQPKTSVQVDLSNFGGPVDSTPPPASKVFVSKNGTVPGLGG